MAPHLLISNKLLLSFLLGCAIDPLLECHMDAGHFFRLLCASNHYNSSCLVYKLLSHREANMHNFRKLNISGYVPWLSRRTPIQAFPPPSTQTIWFSRASQNCYHSVTMGHNGCSHCPTIGNGHSSTSHGCSSASTSSSSASTCCACCPLTSPYEGGPLDLASRHGSSFFRDGALALTSKFTGKVNALQLFLANLKTRAKTCRWDHPTHGILMVAVDGTNYNLLED